MGTSWSACFLAPARELDINTVRATIENALEDITRQMSTWATDSTISCLNLAQTGWYQLPEAFFYVLRNGLDVAQQTSGAYDPTLGQLVDLWGFGPGGKVSAPPNDHDIHAALANTGWQNTALNHEHRGVWQPGGLKFDLSSIAKGYGVDQIAAALDKHTVEHYLVELGGELKTRGLNPQRAPWALAIEIPDSPDVFPISLSGYAIATSGDYRRYFLHDGHRYSHTLNPQTGRPIQHPLASVTVLHEECMMADALATALFCMGPERGLEHAQKHRIPALFMLRRPDKIAFEWTAEFLSLAKS